MSSTIYKIALLGEESVGKTALLVQYLCHRYIGEYDPSIEDIYRRHVKIDQEDVTIDFLDTSSRKPEQSMRENFIKRSDGFIVVYSMTDRKSFLAVPSYKSMIDRSQDPKSHSVPVVLIANKSDLHEHRTVSSRDGKVLAAQYGWNFAEASAATGSSGVHKIFNELIRKLQFNNNMMHLDDTLRRPRSLHDDVKRKFLRRHRMSDALLSSSLTKSSIDSEHNNSSLLLHHPKHSFNLKKILHFRPDLSYRRGSH